MLKRQIRFIINNYGLLSLLSIRVPSRWSKSTLQFPKYLLHMHDSVSTRYTRGFSQRMNCSGGISYLIFRFGIIHCHYYRSLLSVFSFSYYCPLSTLFIALCKIDDESPCEPTRSERIRLARESSRSLRE